MKDLFIPYDLALIAKKNGVNEPCNAYYRGKDMVTGLQIMGWYENTDPNKLYAPLYQQIIAWFKKTHKIAIHEVYTERGDFWRITNINNNGYINQFLKIDLAIEESFKIIENKFGS